MEPKALKKSSAKRSLSKYGARRKEASDMVARCSGERYSERMASANPLTYCSPVGTMMALSVPTSSGIPPRLLQIIGNPIACASSIVVGKGSSHTLGTTATSARRR